ncbi:MAG: endonuclease/exonuclease/phosphatase family protein, partial [Polaribacter sp.]
MFQSILSPKQNKKITTIGFYNVENLFDTLNDPKTLDDDFTADGKKKWNYKRYKIKIKKLGSVISQLGINR